MAPPSWVTFPYKEHPKSDVHALMGLEMLNPRRLCEDVLGVHKCMGKMPSDVQTDRTTVAETARTRGAQEAAPLSTFDAAGFIATVRECGGRIAADHRRRSFTISMDDSARWTHLGFEGLARIDALRRRAPRGRQPWRRFSRRYRLAENPVRDRRGC
jgi:hypothetical protein